MRRLVVLVALTGCSFQGTGNPADDTGDDVADDTGDDTGDDTPDIDAGPGDPDAAPPDAMLPPDAMPPQPVTESFGERAGSDHTGVALDTYLDSTATSTVFEPNVNILVDGDFGASAPATGLLRFNLAAIPVGSTVSAVTLDLHTANNSGGGDEVALYVVNQGWNASATWSSTGSESWFTPGAGPPSRGTDPIAAFGPSSPDTPYQVSIPVGIVQGWVDTPANNRGFALAIDDGFDDVFIRSSNSEATGDRPLLTVTWTPPAS